MDDSISLTQAIASLRASIDAFVACIEPLAPDVLLRTVTEWSPRDVTAHLIGWNVLTLEGCRALQQGQPPVYLDDEESDFQHTNAASVARYTARAKHELLGQLRATADALLAYLERLDPGDWERDWGVNGPSGRPATMRQQVAPLAADYLGHAQEVAAWTSSPLPSQPPA